MPAWQEQAIWIASGLAVLTAASTPFVPWATVYVLYGQVPVRVGISGCFSRVCRIAQRVQSHFPSGPAPPGVIPPADTQSQDTDAFRSAAIVAWLLLIAGFLGALHTLYSCLLELPRRGGLGTPLGKLCEWRASAVDFTAAVCFAISGVAYFAIVQPVVGAHDGHYDTGLWLVLLAAVFQALAALLRRRDEDDACALSDVWGSRDSRAEAKAAAYYMALDSDEGHPRVAPSP